MHEKFRTHLKTGETAQLPAALAVKGILKLLRFDPDMYAVFEIWDRETKSLIKGCEAVAIQGSKLVITVPSVMHRQELLYSKDRILARLNQAMGRRAITDLQFEFLNSKGGSVREQTKVQAGFGH